MPPKLQPQSNSLNNYFKPSPVEKPPKRDWKKLHENLDYGLRESGDAEVGKECTPKINVDRKENRRENIASSSRRKDDTPSSPRRSGGGLRASGVERHSDAGVMRSTSRPLERSGSSLGPLAHGGQDSDTASMSGRRVPRKHAASPSPVSPSTPTLARSASSDFRRLSKLEEKHTQLVEKNTHATTDVTPAVKQRRSMFKPRGSGSTSSNLSQIATPDGVFLPERMSPRKITALASLPESNDNSLKKSTVVETVETMESIEDTDGASDRPRRKGVSTAVTATTASNSRSTSRSTSQTAEISTLKRTGSNLVKEATKNRRTLSPSPSLARPPSTLRRRPHVVEDIEMADVDMDEVDEVDIIQTPSKRTPVVVLPAYDPEWHASRSASPSKRMTRASSRQVVSLPIMDWIDSRHVAPVRKVTPQKVAPTKGQKPIPGLGSARKSRGTTPQKPTEKRTASGRVTRGGSAIPSSPAASDTVRVTRSRGTTPQKTTKAGKPAGASVSFTLPTLDESDEDDLPSPSTLISTNSNGKGNAPTGKSSSSFLSTVPSLPSVGVRSSQRTEVLDSDAESELSDGSGEDSDGSLRRLEDVIIQNATSRSGSTSFGTLSSQRTKPETPTKKGRSGERITSSSRFDLNGQVDSKRKEPEKRYKFDLKSLVRDALQNEETEESARRVTKLLDGNERKGRTGSPSKKRTVELLEQVVEDKFGDESAGKVLRALDVEDIRSVEKTWYFFDLRKRDVWPERSFEKKWRPDGEQWEWMDLLVEKEKRHACLRSGYFVDCVGLTEELPHDVALWMLEGVVKERSELLRRGYADILLAATESLANVVTPARVQHCFKLLGAKEEALEVQGEMKLVRVVNSPHEGTTSGNDWDELKDFIRFLGQAAEDLAFETCEYILGILLRLCADSLVRTHLSLYAVVQTALVNLSEMFDDVDEDGPKWEEVVSPLHLSFHTISSILTYLKSISLTTNLYDTVASPVMLSSILRTLPSTPRIHVFRRRLAYAFFRRSRSLLSQPIDESFHIWQLTTTLESARFNVSRLSDFAALHAKIELLDIALDAGMSKSSPHLYGARAQPLSAPTLRDGDTDVVMGNLILTAGAKKQEEAFNADVDALAEKLKKLWGRIYVDLNDIERKYAKVAIECARRRLLCTVRTKMVPRLKVFDREGDDEGQVEKKKTFMKRFLRGGRERSLGTDGQEDVDMEVD